MAVNAYSAFLGLFTEHLENYRKGLDQKQPEELYQPEAYMLSLGGKRIRPLLALIAGDLLGAGPRPALDAALAVELFHNFSLIHDDILDAAPLRRNQPTVHTRWNSNIAILSGDVMLVKAFQVLASYEGETFRALSTLFHQTAIEVCEGQQMDMNFENLEEVPVADYLKMITLKTAVLLGCSLQMGTITAGASAADQKHLYEFGKHLGISFQLLDDLLDAFAEDSRKFGKQTGGDILANKKTFLLLKAIEQAGPAQKKEINTLLGMRDRPAEKVHAMLSLYRDLDIPRLCREEADRHTAAAIAALEKTEAPADKKQQLRNFALELLNRQI
jgi:geranylgeranyl diphosphate synthase type II